MLLSVEIVMFTFKTSSLKKRQHYMCSTTQFLSDKEARLIAALKKLGLPDGVIEAGEHEIAW
jgi:hypothetical protein